MEVVKISGSTEANERVLPLRCTDCGDGTGILNLCLPYKGKDRSTTTGAAEELTMPSNSKRAIISCAPSSQAYIELNGDASTASPLYIEDPFGPIVLDLGSVTKLSVYVVAGNVGAVFFG